MWSKYIIPYTPQGSPTWAKSIDKNHATDLEKLFSRFYVSFNMIVWRNIVFGCLSSSRWFVCWLWGVIWLCCMFWCMIIVIVHFTMSIIWVSPLQLQYQIKNYKPSKISLFESYFIRQELERIDNFSTYFCFKCMVFLWKIFFSEMILVPSFVTPFINLVLWYVYILKIMIWCISTWFGTRNWYLWKGYCQAKNKCQAENAELKKKNSFLIHWYC